MTGASIGVPKLAACVKGYTGVNFCEKNQSNKSSPIKTIKN